MMFKCVECGRVFDEPKTWKEDFGEIWSGCPFCGSGFEEAVRCGVCDEWFLDDELLDGVCDFCGEEKLNEYKYDFKTCFEIAKKEDGKKIEINSFLGYIYTKEQIEKILFKDLFNCSSLQPIDCSGFINGDKSWFLENILKLEKEKKESEH